MIPTFPDEVQQAYAGLQKLKANPAMPAGAYAVPLPSK
jgi:hypothetical protein